MHIPPPATSEYPINLRLTDRLVVIVGAGRVGSRKLQGVLAAGAAARLVDPTPVAGSDPRVEHRQHPFRSGDLQDAALVFACTDNPAVNQQVAAEAARLSIWCCRADAPQEADFSLPALLRRGGLTIAVATGGSSPALAAVLRDQLAELVPPSWGKAVELVAAIRRKWLTEPSEVQYNQEVLRNLLDRELIPLIAHGQIKKIDRLLQSRFGPGFTLAELQIQLDEGAP